MYLTQFRDLKPLSCYGGIIMMQGPHIISPHKNTECFELLCAFSARVGHFLVLGSVIGGYNTTQVIYLTNAFCTLELMPGPRKMQGPWNYCTTCGVAKSILAVIDRRQHCGQLPP
jgi:hypothetical protein